MARCRDCLHQEGILGSPGIEARDLPTPCKETDPEEPGGSVLSGGSEGRELSHWRAHPILSFCSVLTAAMPLSLDHVTCIRILALPLWRQVTCSWTGSLNFISPDFLTSKTGVEYLACFLRGPSFCEKRCWWYGRHYCVSSFPLAIVWSEGRKQTCQVMVCILEHLISHRESPAKGPSLQANCGLLSSVRKAPHILRLPCVWWGTGFLPSPGW